MRSVRIPLPLVLLGALTLSGCGEGDADAPAPEEAVTDSGPAEEETEEETEEEPYILEPEGSDVAWRFPEEIEGWFPSEESRDGGVRFLREGEFGCTLSLSYWEGNAAEAEAEGGDVRGYLEDTVDRAVETEGIELESLESSDPVEISTHPGGDSLEFTVIRVEMSALGITSGPQYHGAHWYGDDALTTILSCGEASEEGYEHEWVTDLLDVVTVAVD